MSDALDWRDLFKRYMKAVYSDDYIVAHRTADPSTFDGTDDECAAVWSLFVEAHREEYPAHSALRTQEEVDAIEAAKTPYQRAKERADYYKAGGDLSMAEHWYRTAELRKLKEG